MKKLMSLLIVFAILLTFCACGPKDVETTAPTTNEVEATEEPQATKPDPFADINELEPNDKGVYEIHSPAGVLNIANNLDGEYELLCNIDMGGVEWVPVGTQDAPFTGKLNGSYFTISNFTISQPTKDGDMGMFGVNKGNIVNVLISDLTVTTTADTLRAGGLVGSNQGNIRRGTVTGTLNAETFAEGASIGGIAGVSTKLIENTESYMDVFATAEAKADIGGGVGNQKQGKFLYNIVGGKIDITNGSNKNLGLFIGCASETELEETQFVGGVSRVDGALLTTMMGVQQDTTNIGYALRDNAYSNDPLPEDAMKRRETVVNFAREMATVEWTVREPFSLDNCLCTCTGDYMFMPGKVYRGIPYNHKSGSLDRFYYSTKDNGDGTLGLQDWIYDIAGDEDGWGAYIGNDCSSAMQMIYGRVSNHCSVMRSVTQFPIYATEDYQVKETFPLIDVGTIPVGWSLDGFTVPNVEYIKSTSVFTDKIGEQGMYEAYAHLRAGDMVSNSFDYAQGHCQVVSCDAVVMRDADGNLDPDASYITVIEQVASFQDFGDYISSWRVDKKVSFRNLLAKWYIPVTFKELLEGSDEVPEVTIDNQAPGRMGLVTGTINSNFYLDSVVMVVTDEAGNEVLNKRMFPTVDKTTNSGSEYWTIRNMPKYFDMNRFAKPVSEVQWDTQKAYSCKLTVHLLSGDVVELPEFVF